ncbi:MAG: tetraacyldisaccharide 4'-kinase [Planctomycetota bacterium]
MPLRRAVEDFIQMRTTGIPAALLRGLLVPAMLVYGAAVAVRNLLYDAGILTVARAGMPVISVGNLTAGGTGKTPLVMHIARQLRAEGRRPAVIARGYGGRGGSNDEIELVRRELPGMIALADPDRVAAARRAVAAGADVIILDDGFQHRRLHRDCDILAIDARTVALPKLLLPAGPFREWWGARRRAHLIAVTKCAADAPPPAVAGRTPGADLFAFRHRPAAIRRGERTEPVDALAGTPVFLFAGIADPAHFQTTVAAAGIVVAGTRFFPDHHAYTPADLEAVAAAARAAGAAVALTTEKDAVKTGPLLKNAKNTVEFMALAITMAPVSDGTADAFWDRIHEHIRHP